MRVSFANVDGVRTRFYDAGSGLPVVLVHGGGAAADTWIRNIPTLAKTHRVIAPDLIGHGFSDWRPYDTAAPQRVQAQHVLSLTRQLGLSNAVIVGHSFGGLIAALLALENPQLYSLLVIVGSASVFHPPSEQQPVLENALTNQLAAHDDLSIESLRRRNIGSNFQKGDPFEEILLVQLTAHALPDRKTAFVETIKGLIDSAAEKHNRVYHRLEEFQQPTLVVSGRQDPRADWQRVCDGVKRMPGARLEIFEDCGHKPYSEHAAKFNEVLLDFLKRPLPPGAT